MADNQHVNKVVYDGQTLVDLTADTVAADKLLEGYTAHDASGAPIEGTIADGNLLGYGTNASSLVGAGKAGYAIVNDSTVDITGRALSDFAVLAA